MTNKRTTIAGALAAAATALAAVPGLPDRLRLASLAVAAVATAGLGFFAQDAVPVPRVRVKYLAALAASAVIVIVAGCTLANLATRIAIPPFGTIDLSIGGGTIGRPCPPTNTSNTITTNTPT